MFNWPSPLTRCKENAIGDEKNLYVDIEYNVCAYKKKRGPSNKLKFRFKYILNVYESRPTKSHTPKSVKKALNVCLVLYLLCIQQLLYLRIFYDIHLEYDTLGIHTYVQFYVTKIDPVANIIICMYNQNYIKSYLNLIIKVTKMNCLNIKSMCFNELSFYFVILNNYSI